MPFADGAFDLVWMQNVGMHIADKGRLYAEIARVLRPGGRFARQEILAGATQPAHYPTPWAATAAESFLLTDEELRDLLATAGLREVARKGVPVAPRANLLQLLWDEAANRAMDEASRRNAAEGRIAGVMLVAERV